MTTKQKVGRPPKSKEDKQTQLEEQAAEQWLWAYVTTRKDHPRLQKFIEYVLTERSVPVHDQSRDPDPINSYGYAFEIAPQTKKAHYHIYIYGKKPTLARLIKEEYKVERTAFSVSTQFTAKEEEGKPKYEVQSHLDNPVKLMSYLVKGGDYVIKGISQDLISKGIEMAAKYEKEICHYYRMCASLEESTRNSKEQGELGEVTEEVCIETVIDYVRERKMQCSYNQAVNYGQSLFIRYGHEKDVKTILRNKMIDSGRLR